MSSALSPVAKKIVFASLVLIAIVIFVTLFFVSKKIFFFTLLSCAPISELRGSIPLSYLSYNWQLIFCYIGAIILNWLVAPLLLFFLDHLHPLLTHLNWYDKTVNKFLTKAHSKLHDKVERYGMWGIMLFIAIPLPITGVYTGVAGAWVLGLQKRKTILSALFGVIISATIVATLCYLIKNVELSDTISKLLNIFIKEPAGV